MKNNTFKLIEAVAENLAKQLLLKISNLREIEIEIKKPWAPIGLPIDCVGVKITRKWHTAYIALGSNMGNRQGFLDMAADEIDADENCVLLKIADSIETKAYGVEDQDDFLNSCVEVRTLYSPDELLKLCNSIEKKANRVRKQHWGPRTLDMDIIFYDDEVIEKDNLCIPHIEMHKRDFVLRPLSQIAPNKVHPLLKKRVVEMLDELKEPTR
jgi:dihydroneopterin aldolase/2-amino-4-hydroxy-6-hydroxymethyldihydropteridine diphosphokinase